MKNIVIRTDSSFMIGSGHVMRCLTLAGQLRKLGCSVQFVSRCWPGHILSLVEKQGFAVHLLPDLGTIATTDVGTWLGTDADSDAVETWEVLRSIGKVDGLVIDHYGIDYVWECRLRPLVKHMLVIDDLANRRHECDALLDQNFYFNLQDRYRQLVPESAKLFLGPGNALLRDEFFHWAAKSRVRDGHVRTILVFFGGSDLTNETGKAIKVLKAIERTDLQIVVVVGGSNPHIVELEASIAGDGRFRLYRQTQEMARLMFEADLAIGAGGTATWERCVLGLPTLAMILVENQRQVVEDLHQHGVLCNLGWNNQVTFDSLNEAVLAALNQPNRLAAFSERSIRLMAGSGEMPLAAYMAQA